MSPAGSATWRVAAAAPARRVAGITAVSFPALTRVGVRVADLRGALQRMRLAAVKPIPVKTTVRGALPAMTEVGVRLLRTGLMWRAVELDISARALTTVRDGAPERARVSGVMAALSSVALM